MDTQTNLELRGQVLSILLKNFSAYSTNHTLYECADEWLIRGNLTTDGLINFFESYYK